MTWRDGVHVTGTPIWCDARRRREVCFLSSADRVGRTGHGQLIGTAITLALVDAPGPGHLAVPLRQRFTLGTVRLELIPSGRGFGAAALHADVAGRTVLYAGAVRTSTGGVGDAAELRACDAVVVAAPYGEPRHQFPALPSAIAAAIEWTRAQLAAGRRPVLLVDSVLDGLEVASRLAAETIAIAGSRALREAAHRISELVPPPQLVDGEVAIGRTIAPRAVAPRPRQAPRSGEPRDATRGGVNGPASPGQPPAGGKTSPLWIDPAHGADLNAPSHLAVGSQTFPRLALDAASGIPVIAAPGREPRAVVWLDADRPQLARALGDRPAATALVSARALDGTTGYDAGFAWASAADRAQLLAWIEATGARDVFVTGACADAIVAALGARARVIGPPHQMPLFPREATS